MVIGLDSATPPTQAQALAARAAGVAVWSGYLATRPRVGLANPWTQADFDAARLVGGMPIAFASGWDDPVACKALAAAWRVRLCLDVEDGIRGDGLWVPPWLNGSGAGLYGTRTIHLGRVAAFHIAAWYINADPSADWPAGWSPPSTPCGWQWHNTHTEFGVSVDRSWLDPWFGGSSMSTRRALVRLAYRAGLGREPASVADIDAWANSQYDDEEMVMHIIDSTEGTAYTAKLAGVLTAGPVPGPKGDKGDPGPGLVPGVPINATITPK